MNKLGRCRGKLPNMVEALHSRRLRRLERLRIARTSAAIRARLAAGEEGRLEVDTLLADIKTIKGEIAAAAQYLERTPSEADEKKRRIADLETALKSKREELSYLRGDYTSSKVPGSNEPVVPSTLIATAFRVMCDDAGNTTWWGERLRNPGRYHGLTDCRASKGTPGGSGAHSQWYVLRTAAWLLDNKRVHPDAILRHLDMLPPQCEEGLRLLAGDCGKPSP